MKTFEERFEARTPKSKQLFMRAKEVLPGGVSSTARGSWVGWHPYPLFIGKGEGSRVFDVDGNEYIDYLLGLGPMLLGHRPKKVTKAVNEFIANQGTIFATPYSIEEEVARKMVEVVPCLEKVRFCSSGTEAAASAVRLARAYTGKEKIVRFEGNYHGWADTLYWSNHPDLNYAGPEENPVPLPAGPGVPTCLKDSLIVLSWNDPENLEKTLTTRHQEIAAVISEPIMCNTGTILPKKGYLKLMRDLTQKYGVLLIFDEVITGFRISLGGAQQYYGIIPDLCTFAKGLGGGFPVAAFGGKREIMDLITKGVYSHSGTYNSNGIAISAAKACLEELSKPGIYEKLHYLGDTFMEGLGKLFKKFNIPVQIQGLGPVFQVWFSNRPIHSHRDAFRFARPDIFNKWWEEMILEGVLFHPNQLENLFISLAHKEGDIEDTLAKTEKALNRLKQRLY